MNSNIVSNTPIVRHLDNCYRRRWELYYSDKVYDSRKINWKDVPGNITKIETYIEGQIHTVDNLKGSLIRWRFAGQEWIDGKLHKIDTWCIGYHDGTTCFMKEIQFKDGSMKETQYLLEEYRGHL